MTRRVELLRSIGICAVVILALGSAPARAQSAVVPAMVIEDGNGNPLGPVVGFTMGGQDPFALVRLIDPVNNVPVVVTVFDSDDLVAGDNRTYFSAADCTGTAYHAAGSEQGLPAVSGYNHSIARQDTGPPGNQKLFASSVADAGSSTSYASQYVNNSCSNSGGTSILRTATAVLDIDAAHPTPYSFP
jgi:hypothetical protein